jgi:hypothetical protein
MGLRLEMKGSQGTEEESKNPASFSGNLGYEYVRMLY